MGEILFLAHRIPFPPDRGDKIRSHHLLKALARLGPVHVGCFADDPGDMAHEPSLSAVAASHCLIQRDKSLVRAGLEALASGRVSLTAFDDRRLRDWVEAILRERDIAVIFVFSGQMGQYVPADFAGRVVIDLCDVNSAKFEDYAATGERVWLNRREARLLAREEERLAHRADATLLISDSERQLFESRLIHRPAGPVRALGNGIDADFFDPAMSTAEPTLAARPGPHFIFAGQMDYRPNELAAMWAIEAFLPEIRTRYPEAEVHVVGRNPSDRLRASGHAHGAQVWGGVPDMRPFLAAADCALVPLTIARGVQNKVLEAMAMELPVLLTGEAATGIAGEDGRDWLLAPADARLMAARFTELWDAPGKAAEMGRAARRFVLAHHAWDAVLAPLAQIVVPTPEVRRNAA